MDTFSVRRGPPGCSCGERAPHKRRTRRFLPIIALYVICYLTTSVPGASGINLYGSTTSHAVYPKWNACINASISFQFRTTQDKGLLMYVDDGQFDFFQVLHDLGQVRVTLNIVDGRDGAVEIDVGNRVNDGRWHTVEIRRNRMETTLVVDADSDSRFSFGSDFDFGTPANNSYVFFGGVPQEGDYVGSLHKRSSPRVLFEEHFRGDIRNVLYGNCTCQRVRATVLSGQSFSNSPRESCEVAESPCREGCLCITQDDGPHCDCSELKCVTGKLHHIIVTAYLLIVRHDYSIPT